MALFNTFIREAKQKDLFGQNSRVLVAFSGGKDSLCLLSLFLQAAKEWNLTLGACHVHHGIRGDEADSDAKLAEEFCRKKKIPFYLEKTDVPAFCKENGLGLEEGARIERYRILEEVRRREGFDLIATAHSASDQAETVLFRLIRGTGLCGVAGIPAKRDRIIRPLLPFTQEEILSYCEENSLLFTKDSSNDDITISRNRIRSVIFPEIKKINPNAEKALNRFALMARWQEEMLRAEVSLWEEKNGIRPEDGKIPLKFLEDIAKEEKGFPLLYEILSKMTKGTNISIPFERFLTILAIINAPLEGKIIEICSSMCFYIENGSLLFGKIKEEDPSEDFFQKVDFGVNEIKPLNETLILSSIKNGNVTNINKKRLILEVNSDKIVGSLFVRNFRSGDKIQMNGMRKSIKKLFCDGKIPKQYRNKIPLLCDEEEILWVPFFGLSDKAREENGTTKFAVELRGKLLEEIYVISERNSKSCQS